MTQTKKYSQLNIIQAINFKSWCVAQTFALYGERGFTQHWMPISCDGIILDLQLHEYQYNRPYKKGDIKIIG